MSFVETLNRLMKDNQTSNVSLGKAIGVSDVAVMRWKKGEAVPSLDNAMSIAAYFGISLDDLASDKLNLESTKHIRLPVIGKISIFGIYPHELWAEDYINIASEELAGYPREECYALAMYDDIGFPDCHEAFTYVLFHQQSQCASGDNVIIHKEGSDELMFKTFQWNKDSFDLLCPNPNYKTISFRKQDINKLKIEAVMIGIHNAL